MENEKLLSEKRFQKNKKKITIASLVILIIGVLVGGGLIMIGLANSGVINFGATTLTDQIETEKQKLITSKTALETKIQPVEAEIKTLEREDFTGYDDAYYAREDRIAELEASIATDKSSIDTIDQALDETFAYCRFDEAKNNSYTSNYCSLKNRVDSPISSVPLYMIGAFVIITSCMIAGQVYIFAKRREIAAFTTQQVMPVAQEGIEKMSPTIGKAAGTIAKDVKEGLKEDKK